MLIPVNNVKTVACRFSEPFRIITLAFVICVISLSLVYAQPIISVNSIKNVGNQRSFALKFGSGWSEPERDGWGGERMFLNFGAQWRRTVWHALQLEAGWSPRIFHDGEASYYYFAISDRIYLTHWRWRPYITPGIGVYGYRSRDDEPYSIGVNVGAGVERVFYRDRLGVTAGIQYHNAYDGSDEGDNYNRMEFYLMNLCLLVYFK